MTAALDHWILRVNDTERSVAFYRDVMGFAYEGRREPFAVLRVNDDLLIQLADWGTEGNEHFAFALSSADFDAVFARIRERDIPFGDSFHSVGNGEGPGIEEGARGPARSLYCFDPDRHLIEIRCYDA